MKRVAFLLAVVFASVENSRQEKIVEDQKYWSDLAKNDINSALNQIKIDKVAKNVILFVGDGLGLSTTTASRIYDKTETGYLAFEKFPYTGFLKTYSANKIVPDSCSTATALFCGVKANQRTAGVDATVSEGNCEASLNPDSHLDSILKWGQDAKKATGFVTTTRVTHATPSALYAHNAERRWECEAKMPKNASMCKDIARQLVEDTPGKYINVIMGGGRQCLQSNVTSTESDPVDTWGCYSSDGRDLIRDWRNEKISRSVTHKVVTNTKELKDLEYAEYVLGIFANGHVMYDHKRGRGPTGMPSLSEMTEASINLLNRNDNGFILMVEGGLIDMAHHRGHARQALSETIAFNAAIEKALQITNKEETLIIVTSDHSHPLVISGYPLRGTPITGLGGVSKMDQQPYTTLLYGTGGPDNYKYKVIDNKVAREDPTTVDTHDFDFAQQAAILADEVLHEGTDVAIYALGPMAHLFHTVHEQTYVAHVIAYAAKIGAHQNETNIASNLIINQYTAFGLMLLNIYLIIV